MKNKTLSLEILLKRVSITKIIGSTNVGIAEICNNSAQAVPKSLFAAIKGANLDGHTYIDAAIEKGSVAIICEIIPDKIFEGVTYILVEEASLALAHISSSFYGTPSSKLKLVAVTGTSGKTTTVHLLYHIFMKFGYKVGLLSTINNKIGDKIIEANLTTPDAITINKFLAEMVEFGCEYCFMEASSHAIDQNRVSALNFAGVVFLNISHEHLDYHKTFAKYIEAKKKIFDNLSKESFSLVNIDDKNAAIMLQNTKAHKYSFSLKSSSHFQGRIISNTMEGLELKIDNFNAWLPIVGEYNAYNAIAAYAVAFLLGKNGDEILLNLSTTPPVPGRFECLYSRDGLMVVIDYAHKPDALSNLLQTIQKTKKPDARIILVMGCGGNRDSAKRPIMASIASNLSDFIIFTSDNPRFESPETIIEQMKAGVSDEASSKNFLSIVDREEAIKAACAFALPKDIVVIVGRGHETHQIINGIKRPFSDREVAKKWMSL